MVACKPIPENASKNVMDNGIEKICSTSDQNNDGPHFTVTPVPERRYLSDPTLTGQCWSDSS